MDKQTRDILAELQNGFKLETRPFKRIAVATGCSEEVVINTIKDCLEKGLIRRIGVAARPEKFGHKSNALVAWKVPEDRVEEVGKEVAAMSAISHCYDRECPQNWDLNFFTMIHARDDSDLKSVINEIIETCNLSEYKIFKTVKELKKTSMRYFEQE